MPQWVEAGFSEYAKRLPKDYQLSLIELPLAKRGKSIDIARTIREEGEEILKKIPPDSFVVALDEHGESFDTKQLATKLENWHDDSQDLCLIIGGPDGLDQAVRTRAKKIWSLSKLTMPHPLVRILIAEQIYRAWSIMQQHPYHRE